MNASGKQLRDTRKMRGWTQVFLGSKMGVKREYIAVLEHRENIPIQYIPKLDKIFGGTEWRTTQTIQTPTTQTDYQSIRDDMERKWVRCQDDIRLLVEKMDRVERRVAEMSMFPVRKIATARKRKKA